jgi:uncharacterized protein YmfQ (DUF2313 family)
MSRSVEQYRNLLHSLLPQGEIWKKDNSKVLAKILLGLAYEFNRIDIRTEELLTERDSRYVEELLTEFEAEYGLPEEGLELESTTERRRNVVHSKVIAIGDQDEDYFIAIAEALGYTIEIETFRPAWAGVATAGDTCGDQNVLFKWIVWVDANAIEYSIDVNLTQLIHDIVKVKPGHTQVFFRWKGPAFSRAFSRAFDSVPHYDNYWPESENAFSPAFSDAFPNNTSYHGVNYTGAFSQAFSIAFDRKSGGAFSKAFAQAFDQPN